MAKFTHEQMARKFERNLEKIIKFNIPFALAVKNITALQSQRIFTRGLNSAGSQIGSYNQDNPIYVSDKNSPRKGTNRGKPSGKKGKKNKTTYYSSYKDFKQKMQGQSGKVNLKLFNELQSDFSNTAVAVLGGRGSSTHNPVKFSPHHYQITLAKEINQKKAEGLQDKDKYGQVFDLTKKERNLFLQTLQKELKLAMTS